MKASRAKPPPGVRPSVAFACLLLSPAFACWVLVEAGCSSGAGPRTVAEYLEYRCSDGRTLSQDANCEVVPGVERIERDDGVVSIRKYWVPCDRATDPDDVELCRRAGGRPHRTEGDPMTPMQMLSDVLSAIRRDHQQHERETRIKIGQAFEEIAQALRKGTDPKEVAVICSAAASALRDPTRASDYHQKAKAELELGGG